ncbi:MAG: DUF4239 domain-containing protein [Candidatus Korobacteraceae bacterium]
MVNTTQSIVFPILAVIASLLFMVGLNWVWPWEKRREHNDQIGWQLSVLGTTYAVILGFMLYAVWTAFGIAQSNVDLEGNDLVNVYRLAEGLPDQQRVQLQKLTQRYADVVIDQDWPQMAADQVPDQTREINRDMWKTLMSVKAASPNEIAAEDHALYELSALTEHRRTRILQSISRLPTVLWCVLIVGGAVTVASSCLFGSANSTLHALQVFAFSLLISLALIAIADINRPFQGSIHVSNYAFIRAQQNMQGP